MQGSNMHVFIIFRKVASRYLSAHLRLREEANDCPGLAGQALAASTRIGRPLRAGESDRGAEADRLVF
jgi:hypothetical protein